jgi:hypothetical protein
MMTSKINKTLYAVLIRAACLLFGAVSGQPVFAQVADNFPNRPITIIIPFTAGGSSDLTARRVGDAMGKILKQPIIVQNLASAGGIFGVNSVVKAPKDGYTLLAGTISTHAINAGLYKNLPYDPLKDFVPITRIGSFPNILVVQSSLKINTLPQLIELARQRQAQGKPLNYASGGVGSTSHLGGELLRQVAGVEMIHVPYKGAAGAMGDLLGGRIDLIFGNSQLVLPHIKTGQLVPLAVTTSARSDLLPNVPTVTEIGFAEAEMSVWIGLFAPAGIPEVVANKLSAAALQALTSPEVLSGFTAEGVFIEKDESPAQFLTELSRQVALWKKVIDKAGIAIEIGQ